MEEPQAPLFESDASCSAEALRELQVRAQAVKTGRRERLSQLELEITRQIEVIAETLSAQQAADADGAASSEQMRAELEELRARLDTRDGELAKRAAELAEFESQLMGREVEVTQRSSELDDRDAHLSRRDQELDAREQAINGRDALWGEQQSSTQALEAQLAEQQSQITALQTAAESSSAQLAGERDKLRASLSAQRDELAAVEQATVSATAERDELQQKFSLAHEDVQRFRSRVAELEQELANRPAKDQTDTIELVAVRAERDALAQRVEELENQPQVAIDGSADEQLADLQRRFELAVEDVRELKNKNALLESKLAAPRAQASTSADAGGMDWESQKRRMLASLEGAADDRDPAREEELASITNTIQITDAVVAEKDEQIRRLQAQLVEAAVPPIVDDQSHEAAVSELVDQDEVIKEHRRRIAQLQQELEDKLRAAELELSVERAKIARQRAELDQLKVDLDAVRKNLPSHGTAAAPQLPKKRWLSKLGLTGDE